MEEEILVGAKKNNKDELTLNDLVNSGKYSSDLIDYLKRRDFDKVFFYIGENDRKDRNYMEPLLYAVKHDLGTFAIFKYCPENLQRDERIAKDVIQREPELLLDTPLSRDVNFILKNAKYSPRIINYVDRELLKDDYLVCSLCYISNSVASEVVKNTGIDIAKAVETEHRSAYDRNDREQTILANDREFIEIAIKEKGAGFLRHASDDVKNDYDFLKEQTKQNSDIIDFAINNVDEFGKDGIEGIRQASTEMTIEELWKLIESDPNFIEFQKDPSFEKLQGYMNNAAIDDHAKLRVLSSFYLSKYGSGNPEQMKIATEKVIKTALIDMETIKKDLDENGNIKIKTETSSSLQNPTNIRKLIETAKSNGITIDEELLKRIDEYQEFYVNYKSQYRLAINPTADKIIKMIEEGRSAEEVLDEAQDLKVLHTAAIKISENQEASPELVIGIINCSFVEMNRIKNDLDENGEIKLSRTTNVNLISPPTIQKMVQTLESKGIVLDDDFQKRIDEYTEFYKYYRSKLFNNKTKINYSKKEESLASNDAKPQQDVKSLLIRFNDELNLAMNTMNNVRQSLDENGNMIIDRNVYLSLSNPLQNLNRIIKKLGQQSITIDPEMKEKYDIFMSFYSSYKKMTLEKIASPQMVSINNVENSVSDQKISNIRLEEQRLVENIQESSKINNGIQQADQKPTIQEDEVVSQEQQSNNSAKEDAR